MPSKSEPSYEDLGFEGRAVPSTAPSALLLTARVHGGPRPPLEHARLLELGCGDGANLLPLAFHHPDWTLVGVDASARATDVAERGARALGLENVRFICADVASFAPEGEHDYVIAHGLYSWIDEVRQAALRRLVRAALAPSGLAYVSFNAQPGWGARGRVRDALVRWPTDLAGSRARVDGLAALLGEPQHPWGSLLSHELERAAAADDGYLGHEYLAAHNHAFWLGEVVRDFGATGLRYVGDATFDRPEGFVAPALRERARSLADDPIAVEEMIDLIAYRQHRAAVFARDDAAFDLAAGPELLVEARVASAVRALNDPFDPSPGVEEPFRGPHGTEVRVAGALSKMALLVLARDYPRGHRVDALAAIARTLLPPEHIDGNATARLRSGLWELWRNLELELRMDAPRLGTTPGPRPVASALSRYEAACRPALTTPLHGALPLEPIERAIVTRLDGTRTPSEVVSALTHAIEAGALQLEGIPSGAARVTPVLEMHIERTLTTLGWWGLVD